MTTISSYKSTKNNLQRKDLIDQNLKTLNRLASQPNITIKKKPIVKTYAGIQIRNPQNKVTNSENKVTDSQNRTVENKRKTKSPKNIVGKKNSKATDKSLLIKNSEYYPDRCKRNVPAKKIKLHPKHEYQVVATTNKRKRRIPHRDVDSIQPPFNPLPESPLQESRMKELPLRVLVQLAEDQGLDDEDFLEILTCPSPVWWEETSDDEISLHEDFDKEAMAELKNKNEIVKKTITDAKPLKIDNKLKTDLNFYKKFVTKRAKLESILGKIKHKDKKPVSNDIVANKRLGICDKQNINAIDNIKNSNNNNLVSLSNNKEKHINYVVHNNLNDFKDHKEIEGKINGVEESTISELGNRKRKISSGDLSDVSITEDELLNTLENIELPVKTSSKAKVKNRPTNEIVMMEIRNKPVKNNEITSKNVGKRKRPRKRKNNNKLELKDEINSVKDNNEIAVDKLTDQTEMEVVPTDLPPLTKNPFKNKPKACDSPKSIESHNSETTIITEFDSISDTNIKFLDEYVDNRREPTEAVNIKKYGQGKDGEMVTVYQIIANKSDSMDIDIEQQIKVNLVNKSPQITTDVSKNNGLNSFFKTRKSAYRSRSKYKKK